jgi:FAD/FMN-containing dehydrogenase
VYVTPSEDEQVNVFRFYSPSGESARCESHGKVFSEASFGDRIWHVASTAGYVNMMMDESADHVQAAYRDNYARLAQIKATYDPSNLFHVNQNIKPTR